MKGFQCGGRFFLSLLCPIMVLLCDTSSCVTTDPRTVGLLLETGPMVGFEKKKKMKKKKSCADRSGPIKMNQHYSQTISKTKAKLNN